MLPCRPYEHAANVGNTEYQCHEDADHVPKESRDPVVQDYFAACPGLAYGVTTITSRDYGRQITKKVARQAP